MNYLKLASEVFYANITKLAEDPTQLSNLEAIISFFSLVIENSIDCLSISVRAVCLEKPGTHDYLQRLSESICIAIEAKTFRRDIFVSETAANGHLLNQVKALLGYSKEYETYIVRGFVNFFKRLLGLNEQLEVNEELLLKSKRTINESHKMINEVVSTLVKENVLYSIINSQEVSNRLNLKTVMD
jgi:hypothetical protein